MWVKPRIFTWLTLLCLLFFYGCAVKTWGTFIPNRTYNFPPSWGSIEIYPDKPSDKPYFVLGTVNAHGNMFTDKEDVFDKLKEMARELRADAIIEIEYYEKRKENYGTGKAIRWKTR